MSFSAYSKEFTANMYTTVENKFITRYLPQADGDAVRAYLYGLYLCGVKDDFDAHAMAKLLKIAYSRLQEIFVFWEECDLVRVLSREPLFVEYLPVSSSAGRPKPLKAEKYSQFNRELLKQLQKAGKDFKPYEHQRILEFLENYPMEPQAFLLISEYCARKDGDKLSSQHILNKAKKLCEEHKYTFEQVERELLDFNENERELSRIYSILGIYKKPQESDYPYLERWREAGVAENAVYAAANALKKGTVKTLDALIFELIEKGALSEKDAKEYLLKREKAAELVFAVARKLGIKVQNPRAYIEEYAEKWLERGYDENSLVKLASFCFKMGYDFEGMDGVVNSLYESGIVDEDGVSSYLSTREKELKLLESIQSVCGVIKKTMNALDMAAAWRSWEFSDKMILEAAKRAAGANAPLSYMNKLLSEWKRTGVKEVSQIPDRPAKQQEGAQGKPVFKTEKDIAADLRSEREHYYAVLRQKAQERAEQNRRKAGSDVQFAEADAAIKRGEIELARAEVFSPERADMIRRELKVWQEKRKAALARLSLSEESLMPEYKCKKCSDTGFLPDGRACSCYPAQPK